MSHLDPHKKTIPPPKKKSRQISQQSVDNFFHSLHHPPRIHKRIPPFPFPHACVCAGLRNWAGVGVCGGVCMCVCACVRASVCVCVHVCVLGADRL